MANMQSESPAAHLKFDKEELDEIRARLLCESKLRQDAFSDEWEAAFDLQIGAERVQTIFNYFNLSHDDPFAWRSLLEAFVVHHGANRGPKRKITRSSFLELAIDCSDLILQLESSEEWQDETAASRLKKLEPYRSRYEALSQDALRKRIASIREYFGPMDYGDFVSRIREAFPDHVFYGAFYRNTETSFDG